MRTGAGPRDRECSGEGGVGGGVIVERSGETGPREIAPCENRVHEPFAAPLLGALTGTGEGSIDSRQGFFVAFRPPDEDRRSEEHTSELQSLMRISYAVFCLIKKKNIHK